MSSAFYIWKYMKVDKDKVWRWRVDLEDLTYACKKITLETRYAFDAEILRDFHQVFIF